MTHQEFAKALAKFNLYLCLMPWGDRKGTYNLNPRIHAEPEKWRDEGLGAQGMIDHGPENNFVGTFAPKSLYLVMNRHPDTEHQRYPYHYAFDDKSNLCQNVAQINPEQASLWQKDKHYQPNNHKLWALIKRFVHTPVVERDADDFILIQSEEKHGNDTLYGFLDMVPSTDKKHFGRLCDTDDYKNTLAFTSFYTHLPLKVIKQWRRKHPVKQNASNPMKSIRKIISVEKLIPIERKVHWEQIAFHCTKPMYVYDPYQVMKHSLMSTEKGVMFNMALMDLAFKRIGHRTCRQGLLDMIQSDKYRKRHDPYVKVNKALASLLKTPLFKKSANYIELSLDELQSLHNELDTLVNDICNTDDTISTLNRTQSLGEAWALNTLRFAIKWFEHHHAYRYI